MRLTLFIENGEKTVYFEQPIMVTGPRPQVMLKKATVYWNYNNVVSGLNDSVSFDGKEASAPEGYFSFDALETFVKGLAGTHSGTVEFGKNVYNGTSKVKTSKKLKLGKMGLLLGFGENDVIDVGGGGWTNSPNQVDINRGLRYVGISCDAVESEKSLDNGRRSNLIGTLPITSEQSLKGSVQHYTDIESKAEIRKGVYGKMTFRVRGNNDHSVGRPVGIGAVLLELYIG